MTEFSFDLYMLPIPIKLILQVSLIKAMSYWKIWLFTGCAIGGYVHDIHLGNVSHHL